MMRRSLPRRMLLITLLLLLAACGDEPQATVTPAPTAAAVVTPVSSPTPAPTATPEPTATPSPSPTPRANGILIEAQVVDDAGIVRVDEVVSGVAAWVVVHADGGGAPGDVLGATAVPAGVSSDVTVTIDPLLATEQLFVMLHAEGNGDDSFDPAADPPLLVDGAPLTAAVDVQLDISVPVLEVAQQDVDEETGVVVIPAVTALEAGWVALYADDAGGPGELLAFIGVPAGRTRDITLTINRFNATPTLYAALHVDAGEVGRFEPAVDPVVAVAGEPLLVPFAVALPVDVLMLDQPIVDDRLVVSKVLVNQPAWVAVYYDDEAGNNWIIGFAPLAPGINENVVVDLLAEPPVEELYLRLHVDADDPGVFEFPGADGPLLVDDRLPPPTPFRTNPGNYLIARDQVLDEAGVVVPLIVVDQPVWVVIYGDEGGERGPVLGRVRQPAGLLVDVLVPLEDAAPGTVYVALHADDGDALFEPDGADGVLQRSGADIVTPFELLAP